GVGDELLGRVLMLRGRGYDVVPRTRDRRDPGLAADHRRRSDLAAYDRVCRRLAIGVSPELHHRRLALVEHVLRRTPVDLRGAIGCRVVLAGDVGVEL